MHCTVVRCVWSWLHFFFFSILISVVKYWNKEQKRYIVSDKFFKKTQLVFILFLLSEVTSLVLQATHFPLEHTLQKYIFGYRYLKLRVEVICQWRPNFLKCHKILLLSSAPGRRFWISQIGWILDTHFVADGQIYLIKKHEYLKYLNIDFKLFKCKKKI